MPTKYDNVIDRKYYGMVLASGIFWEIFPELSGNYTKDKMHMNRVIDVRKKELEEVKQIIDERKKSFAQ